MATDPRDAGPLDRVETSVGTIEYRDVGRGPVLVFLHLVLAAGDQWSPVVDGLADRYRCVVPNLPLGCHRIPARRDADLSPPGLARAVADILDALDLDDVTLVGNDTGGAIAQIVATRHPERLGRLVLTNCDAYDNFPPPMFRYLKLLARTPGGVWLMGQTLRARTLWRLPIAFGRLCYDTDAAAVEGWGRAMRASGAVRRDAAKALRNMTPKHTLAAAERFGAFDRPVLIAWGEDDRSFPVRYAERLLADFPDAQLERIQHARTFVMWDQPDVLTDLIDKFVAASGGGDPV